MLENNSAKTQISTILRKIPVFTNLTADEYEHIRKICVPTRVDDGTTLFVEGDKSPCMYVLLTGEIQLRTSNQGKIHTFLPGDLLGEIGMIAQQERTATAIACGPSFLMEIDSHAFEQLLSHSPGICFKIMRNVTRIMSGHMVRMTQAGADELNYLLFD